MITFSQFNENDLLPVLHWRERMAEPQPASIQIDAKEKTVTAAPSLFVFVKGEPPVGGFYMHHREFLIPNNITGRALNRVFGDAEFRRLCERIINGFHHFGFYYEDAEVAMDELIQWLKTNITDADCAQFMSARNFVRKHRRTLGITAETSNEAIAEMAETVCAELAADNRAIAGGVEALAQEMIRYRNSWPAFF